MNRFLMCGLLLAGTAWGQKVKDQAEYDLYNSVLQTQNDPSKQLQLLNRWKELYPDSEFKLVRADLFAKDYLALNQPGPAVKASQEALAINPKDATAVVTILRAALYVPPSSTQPSAAEVQKAAEDGANTVISGWDGLRPANVSEADWTKAKAEIEPLAQFVLGWVKVTAKDYAGAETPLKCALATSNNALVQYGLASYWLGTAWYSQHRVAEGLFEIARAVEYTGPGALDAGTRAKAESFLKSAYAGYHGDASGLDELRAQAAKSQLPPEGFSIKSVSQIADEQQAAQAAFGHEHPDLALWRAIRTALSADNGGTYFEQSMKDAVLPPAGGDFKEFKGRVVSQTSPRELVVNVDSEAGDAALELEAPLRGKVEAGTEVAFTGVAAGYTKEPFRVRFQVERKNLKLHTGVEEHR